MTDPAAGADGATTTTTPPPAAWHAPEYAQLVAAKGWKGPDDSLKSYVDLEKFRGAPAERLLTLPEKADDPAWKDIRARVGWKAPDTPEGYEIGTVEGAPESYLKGMTAKAHALGIPKDVMIALVAESARLSKDSMTEFDGEQTAKVTQALAAADAEFDTKHGAKAKETRELMLRAATAAGMDADGLAAIEQAMVFAGEKSLGQFRALLLAAAMGSKEGAFHQSTNSTQGTNLTKEQAQAQLDAKKANPEWAAKALERGTPEAAESMRLASIAAGVEISDETIRDLTKGIARG